MRKMMNKVAGNMKVTVAKAAMLLKDKKGENYVDKAVHKENKKTKLCSREGTGISACSFPACRDGYKCLYVFVKWHF